MVELIEEWFAKRWIRKQVSQGHDQLLRQLYIYIKECAGAEYFEDNQPTLDFYLIEQFQKTVKGCYSEDQVIARVKSLGDILAREFDPRINRFIKKFLEMHYADRPQ